MIKKIIELLLIVMSILITTLCFSTILIALTTMNDIFFVSGVTDTFIEMYLAHVVVTAAFVIVCVISVFNYEEALKNGK